MKTYTTGVANQDDVSRRVPGGSPTGNSSTLVSFEPWIKQGSPSDGKVFLRTHEEPRWRRQSLSLVFPRPPKDVLPIIIPPFLRYPQASDMAGPRQPPVLVIPAPTLMRMAPALTRPSTQDKHCPLQKQTRDVLTSK